MAGTDAMERWLAIGALIGLTLWLPIANYHWGWPDEGIWWLLALAGGAVASLFGRHLLSLAIVLTGCLIAHSLFQLEFMHWGQLLWWCWGSFAILCIGLWTRSKLVTSTGAIMSAVGLPIWFGYEVFGGVQTPTTFPTHILGGLLGIWIMYRYRLADWTYALSGVLGLSLVGAARLWADPAINVNATQAVPDTFPGHPSFVAFWVFALVAMFSSGIVLVWLNRRLTLPDDFPPPAWGPRRPGD